MALICTFHPGLFPHLPESSHSFPPFSIQQLSLACFVEAIQLAHSCLLGRFALNISVYLMYSCEGESSVLTYAVILAEHPLFTPSSISVSMSFMSDACGYCLHDIFFHSFFLLKRLSIRYIDIYNYISCWYTTQSLDRDINCKIITSS